MSTPPTGRPGFSLHPRLLEDCHVLGRLVLCQVLLHRNATLPWFILVPECDAEASEWHDLPVARRRQLEDESMLVSRFLRARLDVHKVNIAAIGNIVAQLHVHVIGRRRDDPCWPGVVWGRLPAGPAWPPGRPAELFAALQAFAGSDGPHA
jgi:diadenosine tetraphosphate (Ap4A) HIT family hydrolase